MRARPLNLHQIGTITLFLSQGHFKKEGSEDAETIGGL